VERVLKPGAVVASFCYGFYPVIVNHPRQEELTAHLRQVKKKITENGLSSVQLLDILLLHGMPN